MPGITNFPLRSTVSAEAGAFRSAAGPTQRMRPLSMIMAELAAAGRPVPSISVKFFNTRTSPWSEQANKMEKQKTAAFVLAAATVPRLVSDLFNAVSPVPPAQSKSGTSLCRGAGPAQVT